MFRFFAIGFCLFCLPADVEAQAPFPSAPVKLGADCGAAAVLTPGSSQYAGSVRPAAGSTACEIDFLSPPAFRRGPAPRYAAPHCDIMQLGRRVEYTLSVTAEYIRLSYPVQFYPAPASFQWSCIYAPTSAPAAG